MGAAPAGNSQGRCRAGLGTFGKVVGWCRGSVAELSSVVEEEGLSCEGNKWDKVRC
jgi:hypothetical protein